MSEALMTEFLTVLAATKELLLRADARAAELERALALAQERLSELEFTAYDGEHDCRHCDATPQRPAHRPDCAWLIATDSARTALGRR